MRAGRLRGVLGAVLFLVAGTLAGASPTAGSGMALWRRAVARAPQSAAFMPASIHTTVAISDGSGRVRSSSETWSHIGVGANGALVTTVVLSLKNGRDNTEAAQAEVDRHPRRSRFDYSLLPMMPQNRDQVEAKPAGESRLVDGKPCAGYTFRLRTGGKRSMIGTLWLDIEHAAPRLMEFSFDPLPSGAKEVKNRLIFAVTPGGGWRPAKLDSYAVGQLLFFKRVFRMEMRFSDYFRPEKSSAQGTSQ